MSSLPSPPAPLDKAGSAYDHAVTPHTSNEPYKCTLCWKEKCQWCDLRHNRCLHYEGAKCPHCDTPAELDDTSFGIN